MDMAALEPEVEERKLEDSCPEAMYRVVDQWQLGCTVAVAIVEGRSLDILAGLELVVYNPVVDRGTALVAGQRDILTQVVVDSGLLED
jgi:hypothetical protein